MSQAYSLPDFIGALVAIVALGLSIYNAVVIRTLEAFKINLQAAHEVELEKLRSELRAISYQHELVLSHLEERRAKVIARLYKLTVQTEDAFAMLVSPIEQTGMPSKQERLASLAEMFTNFRGYFATHRIYLPNALTDRIQELIRVVHQETIHFQIQVIWDTNTNDFQKTLAAWSKASQIVAPQIEASRRLIEDEFRELLGVNPVSPPAAL